MRVPDSSGANLAFALDSQPDGGLLTVELVDSATGKVLATASTSQAAVPAATGRMRVAPGKYIVRVRTSDYYLDRPILRGRYHLWFYRFGFGPEAVSDTFAVGDTRPDRTLLLDLPVEAAEGRAATRKPGRAWDRFEAEASVFHQRVRDGYLQLAAAEPQRFRVIRADRDVDAVAADVWREVERLLPATTLTPP